MGVMCIIYGGLGGAAGLVARLLTVGQMRENGEVPRGVRPVAAPWPGSSALFFGKLSIRLEKRPKANIFLGSSFPGQQLLKPWVPAQVRTRHLNSHGVLSS